MSRTLLFHAVSTGILFLYAPPAPHTSCQFLARTKILTLKGGAFVRFNGFDDQTISARVGLSFLSSEKACANAEKEIPGFNFVGTHSGAVNLWTRMMNPIRVARKGVNTSMLTNFYSGIYRTMINPQDYTNENPLWNSTEPYFDSFYWYSSYHSSRCIPHQNRVANKLVYGTRSDPNSHS